jgi:transposase
MPRDNIILGLRDYRIRRIRGGNPVIIEAVYEGPVHCPFCGSERLRSKDRYIRKLRHQNFGMRSSELHLECHKYLCRDCGRYFNQRFPGIQPRRRSTEVYRRHVFNDHMDGICSKTLAARERIGSATVERWYHDFLRKKVGETRDASCPVELGIDEHFFTRRRGYATTFCDLRRRRVYDIALGRSELSLEGYLNRLHGKDQVRMVCIDLSRTYRTIVKRHFPNATIVADRFHVIRLVNHHFLNTWRMLDPTASRNRGLLSLMRRHTDRLKEEQKRKLDVYLASRPDIAAIYSFKQELCGMFRRKTCNPTTCRKMIPRLLVLIEQLRDSMLEHLVMLGNTLADWIEEIVCMWRYTRNNGITEGFHNKMKMIVRRAYGFRSFENYRLRVRALCG